jgi:hypothetical protein
MGASYSDVPAVQLPKTGGGTARFDDASVTTATASDVASGKVFLASDGTITTGTSSGGGVDGDSAWTKIAETSYQVSTTGTSASTVATWETGHSELHTNSKWVYVRIRDTAGKRAGYFYGSDQFFLSYSLNSSSTTNGIRYYIRCNTSGNTYTGSATSGSTGYGVYADTIYSDGRIRIRKRYNDTSSLTIDGTYKVEVYLLDPAGGIPILE